MSSSNVSINVISAANTIIDWLLDDVNAHRGPCASTMKDVSASMDAICAHWDARTCTLGMCWYINKLPTNTMPSPIERLESYASSHPKEFPKLKPALRAFRGFVGNKNVKDSVARLIMYYISYARVEKNLRRSKRKRVPRKEEAPPRRSRRRIESTDSETVTEEEAGAALIAAFLQVVADHGDSSDEDWVNEDEDEEESSRPEWMVGPLMHVMLVGDPGTGKTTFAQLLVDLWDAIGLVDGARYAKTTRADWVGKYQGHSTQKAKRLIEGNDVIFVDEAYSLVNGRSGDDMYGQEEIGRAHV